uniref:Uncharacterized protein n=1 Tax=Arundo donax TaxID=35708 RepID=A0A0A9G650_ARUDO
MNTSLRSPCPPQPPNKTNRDPFRHDRVWPQRPGGAELTLMCLHSGLLAFKSSTNVSFIGCMLTPSPPKRTTRFPTAQALKLQREGSTAPPTVNFLQATASSVINSRASRPHAKLLDPATISRALVASLPHAF